MCQGHGWVLDNTWWYGNEQKAPPGCAGSTILRDGSNQTGTTALCRLVSLPQTFSPNPEGGDCGSDGLLKRFINLPFGNWQASGWNLDDGEASTLMTQRTSCKWTHPHSETQGEKETFRFYRYRAQWHHSLRTYSNKDHLFRDWAWPTFVFSALRFAQRRGSNNPVWSKVKVEEAFCLTAHIVEARKCPQCSDPCNLILPPCINKDWPEVFSFHLFWKSLKAEFRIKKLDIILDAGDGPWKIN